MASERLNTHVHAVERDEHGNTTRSQVFGPDDDVPDWARKAITNPDVWADGDAEDEDENPGVAASEEPTGGGAKPNRPKGNASRDDWARYAASLDPPVAVNADMNRDAIIAAVDQR